MKKFLSLILITVFAFSLISCASENSDQVDTSTSEETTETTCSCPTDTSETTVDHPHGGTGGLPANETTELTTTEYDVFPPYTGEITQTYEETIDTETTASIDRYNLGMEYIMEYEALILTEGEEYKPYTSTIYYQNPYLVGDGILMFVSMENQLPHWIEEDVIPYIALDENSDVLFEYDVENAELQYSGKFRLYTQDENGVVTKIKEFDNADLADVYAYGKENLAGKTVYISYPFLLQTGEFSYLSDSMFGSRAVHDIMCLFKTSF